MSTPDSPPPVHVHVPDTTPVHLHMGSSSKPRLKVVEEAKPKVLAPWCPPGRNSGKKNGSSSYQAKGRLYNATMSATMTSQHEGPSPAVGLNRITQLAEPRRKNQSADQEHKEHYARPPPLHRSPPSRVVQQSNQRGEYHRADQAHKVHYAQTPPQQHFQANRVVQQSDQRGRYQRPNQEHREQYAGTSSQIRSSSNRIVQQSDHTGRYPRADQEHRVEYPVTAPQQHLPPSRIVQQSDQRESYPRADQEHQEQNAGPPPNVNDLLEEEEYNHRSKPSNGQGPRKDPEVILKALIDNEIDGVTVCNHLNNIKDSIENLSREKQASILLASSLKRQQEMLMGKIDAFVDSNQYLRDLLRDWGEHQKENYVWAEKHDTLLKRLCDSEAENNRLLNRITNMEKEATQMAGHLDFEKDTTKTTEELTKILESTCSHLKFQLKNSEEERAKLGIQMKCMEQNQQKTEEELQTVREEMENLRLQKEEKEAINDQEAFAQLTTRAQEAEDAIAKLTERLQRKESKLAQTLATSSEWCLRHSKAAAANSQLEEEISTLKLQVKDLSTQLQSIKEKARAEKEELRTSLHNISVENTSTKLDNQKLHSELTSAEEKYRSLYTEGLQLKTLITKYENLIVKSKKKLQQSRQESEENYMQLEVVEKEAQDSRAILEKEKEQFRRELADRISELEVLKERLRRTEEELRDVQLEAEVHERRHLENSATLTLVRKKAPPSGRDEPDGVVWASGSNHPERLPRAPPPSASLVTSYREMTKRQTPDALERLCLIAGRERLGIFPGELEDAARVEQQGTQLEMHQQKNLLLHDENKVLTDKLRILERKLEELILENKELTNNLSLKESCVFSLQQQLEEKTRESNHLSRQLQEGLEDAQRKVEDNAQRLLAKEKISQSKVLDLQNQLTQTRIELNKLKADKDEMEQRYESQLENLKERLIQSDSTNRSLQNYVNFLKTSYGNVFNDSLLTN